MVWRQSISVWNILRQGSPSPARSRYFRFSLRLSHQQFHTADSERNEKRDYTSPGSTATIPINSWSLLDYKYWSIPWNWDTSFLSFSLFRFFFRWLRVDSRDCSRNRANGLGRWNFLGDRIRFFLTEEGERCTATVENTCWYFRD